MSWEATDISIGLSLTERHGQTDFDKVELAQCQLDVK